MLCSLETGESAGRRRSSRSDHGSERGRVRNGSTCRPMRSMGSSMSRLRQAPACGTAEHGSFFDETTKDVKKMEYLIVIGVVAMMALYVVIIAGCLEQPEW